MLEDASVEDVILAVVQKANNVADVAANDSQRFELVRDFADAVSMWLDRASNADQETFRQVSSNYFLDKKYFGDYAITESNKSATLILLLATIYNPPTVL